MHFPLRGAWLVTRAGHSLTDTDIDEMWRLRHSIYPIRAEAIDADRLKFAAWARRARSAEIRDRQGRLRGFWLARVEPIEAAGAPVLLFQPEYTFVDPELRGSAWTSIAVFDLLVRHLADLGTRRLWLASIAYPSSLSLIAHYIPEVYVSGDDAPPEPAAILDWLHARAGAAWEPARHRVRLPTCPVAPTPRMFERWQREPRVMRAITRNPEWQRGYGSGVVARLSLQALSYLARGIWKGGRR